jgi:hypothetical protein
MGREEGHHKANPSGLSSVLFYHATIIIHGKNFTLIAFDFVAFD